jgi:hypothetical protein
MQTSEQPLLLTYQPRFCIGCDVALITGHLKDGGNWPPSRVHRNDYRCSYCGACGNPHLHGDASIRAKRVAIHALREYAAIPGGYVYIISNEAFPGWYKVGMAVDAQDRLKSYQTSDPFRGYVLEFSTKVNDRARVERAAHMSIGRSWTRRSEWFQAPLFQCIALVIAAKEYNDAPSTEVSD